MKLKNWFTLVTLLSLSTVAQCDVTLNAISAEVDAVYDQVVSWRRDIHQHPELSNREFRTAKLVERQLHQLGMEVQTNIAHTGVVGVLKGGKPGPVVALRADMDALPVVEQTGLPFASTETATFNGEQVGVMHACGHDAHTAMLLGAATVISELREQLAGTVVFIFQPAEEGPPVGEEGGAKLMLAEGVFNQLRPEAVFALHVSTAPSGSIWVREGIATAGASTFMLEVTGRQTHGAVPWRGIDPITLAGQINSTWLTIPSRYIDLSEAPTPVLTVGMIHGGTRHNIIPDQVELAGTVRYYSDKQRDTLVGLMQGMARGIAEPVGGKIELGYEHNYIPVINNPKLTQRVRPLLAWAANGALYEAPVKTAAEDFSFFTREVPGLMFFVGAAPVGREPAPNHSPMFAIDEAAMRVGVKALASLAFGVGTRMSVD